MNDDVHDWDGAYVLGALSPDDRRRFEDHLAVCAECREAVGRLAGLPGLLGALPREDALALRDLPPDDRLRDGAHVPDLATAAARRLIRRRRRIRFTTAAVVAAVVVAALVGGGVLLGVGRPAVVLAAAREMQPVGDSHLSAELHVTPVAWGTRIDWSCDYRPPTGAADGAWSGSSTYRLVVRTAAGGTTTVATWSADDGEARGLTTATAVPAADIRSIEIRRAGSDVPLARVDL